MNTMHELYYTHPAGEWNEALPLGNGRLGAMVFGGVEVEKISLNEDTLWSGLPIYHRQPGASAAFRRAQGLTAKGEYIEALKLLEDEFTAKPTQMYLPLGDLESPSEGRVRGLRIRGGKTVNLSWKAEIQMKAFNPFIPLDADNSGIPAEYFDIAIKSVQDNVKYTLLLSVQNPFSKGGNVPVDSGNYTAVTMHGTIAKPDEASYGDMTVAVDAGEGVCQTCWYRGSWLENISVFWHDLTHGELQERRYDEPKTGDVCSVGANTYLNAGREVAFTRSGDAIFLQFTREELHENI